MAKRRKLRRWQEDRDEAPDRQGRRSRRRKGRYQAAEPEAAVTVAECRKLPPRPITCHQCGHLIVTRSFVKYAGQSWDRAIVYPTLTCFQQRWTLEDPDSVEDRAEVSPYLVEGADRCPDYQRGRPRDHEW